MAIPKFSAKRYVEVIYDHRFVIEKITSTILNPLKCKDLGEVASLINQDISRTIPVIACKTYSLHGHRVVRVSDLEALGIKVNEIKPTNA